MDAEKEIKKAQQKEKREANWKAKCQAQKDKQAEILSSPELFELIQNYNNIRIENIIEFRKNLKKLGLLICDWCNKDYNLVFKRFDYCDECLSKKIISDDINENF